MRLFSTKSAHVSLGLEPSTSSRRCWPSVGVGWSQSGIVCSGQKRLFNFSWSPGSGPYVSETGTHRQGSSRGSDGQPPHPENTYWRLQTVTRGGEEGPNSPQVDYRAGNKRTDLRREYHLSPKAPPAITKESLQELSNDIHSARNGYTDTTSSATFSGRQETLPISSALERRDFGKFVQFFRNSSSYIAGHRGRLFIICLPGEVAQDTKLLRSILEDIILLNGLGVKLVLAVGTQHQVDQQLLEEGVEPIYFGGYRVTTREAMAIAMQAAGASRTEVESQLSKIPTFEFLSGSRVAASMQALAVHMVRRHARTAEDEHHYGPSVGVVSGNYVTGKRRGIVDGVDFGATGSVRFVQVHAIRSQLDMGNIVLLTNLAYSAAGEVLNCNIYDVATHAAIELGADKLICMTLQEVIALGLPQWLPLTDAEEMIAQHLAAGQEAADKEAVAAGSVGDVCNVPFSSTPASSNRSAVPELELDLDCWRAMQFPNSVVSAVVACKNGVKRTHIVDARIDGGLLLELYSRDGVGSMISTDFYEGIRGARTSDLDNILELLEPLVLDGTIRRRTREEILQTLHLFTVVERESKVLACVLMQLLGKSPDGVECGELAAFCVHPSYRGSGRGDSLLDYVEQDARLNGIRRLVLLTTRTADWFEQRDFKQDTLAHLSKLLPEERRAAINPERNSKLYYKPLYDLHEGLHAAPAGKRIGF